jgi:hypothetical protein
VIDGFTVTVPALPGPVLLSGRGDRSVAPTTCLIRHSRVDVESGHNTNFPFQGEPTSCPGYEGSKGFHHFKASFLFRCSHTHHLLECWESYQSRILMSRPIFNMSQRFPEIKIGPEGSKRGEARKYVDKQWFFRRGGPRWGCSGWILGVGETSGLDSWVGVPPSFGGVLHPKRVETGGLSHNWRARVETGGLSHNGRARIETGLR